VVDFHVSAFCFNPVHFPFEDTLVQAGVPYGTGVRYVLSPQVVARLACRASCHTDIILRRRYSQIASLGKFHVDMVEFVRG